VAIKYIDIGRDFFPELGPRYRADGPYSGQEFREELLEPAVRENDLVVVSLDSIGGYSSSFLEEAFGGLVRTLGYETVSRKLKIDAVTRGYLKPVLDRWMREAAEEQTAGGRP
jgi:hypothetical protein